MKGECVGCGAVGDHPVVAMMLPQDVPDSCDTSIPGPKGFVAVGCCAACHADPGHRSRPIKGHFFAASDVATALFHAGSNSGVGGL